MASPFDRLGSCKIFRSSCSRRQTGGGARGVSVRRRPGVGGSGGSLMDVALDLILLVAAYRTRPRCHRSKYVPYLLNKALLLSTDCFQERVTGSNGSLLDAIVLQSAPIHLDPPSGCLEPRICAIRSWASGWAA